MVEESGKISRAGDGAESVCAVLDLGSNSFHLLIGRLESGRIVTIDRRKDMVRLAQGLGADGVLSEAVMERALDSLSVFAQRLRNIPRKNVRVVGTNTLRAARNADVFLERAERIIGVPVDVISGQALSTAIWPTDSSRSKKRKACVTKGRPARRRHCFTGAFGSPFSATSF